MKGERWQVVGRRWQVASGRWQVAGNMREVAKLYDSLWTQLKKNKNCEVAGEGSRTLRILCIVTQTVRTKPGRKFVSLSELQVMQGFDVHNICCKIYFPLCQFFSGHTPGWRRLLAFFNISPDITRYYQDNTSYYQKLAHITRYYHILQDINRY